MRALIRLADFLSEAAGRVATALVLALVALEFGLVVVRYLFNAGSVSAQEAVLWLHGALFLLALAYALKHGAHVRVDVFSQRWSARTRAWVECLGMLLLLLPMCGFLVWTSWDYVAASWAQHEGSNSGGLPGWYLVKTLIPLSAALLWLQGLAEALRAFARARSTEGAGT
jgi:TRAP-type mannitol/chloroaromatic compound transport system permease small subunit